MTNIKDMLFRVMKGRVLHLNRKGVARPEVWAREGQIVRIDHPVLHEYIKGQEHKLVVLESVPKGEQVFESVPATLSAQLVQHDRMQAKGKAGGEFAAVTRPQSELEIELADVKKDNVRLEARIAELEKPKPGKQKML